MVDNPENNQAPQFLVDLLNARSPTGTENEAQRVVDRYMQPVADEYGRDTMGSRFATVNPGGDPVLMLSGHIDELGLLIKYVDDKGFLYFETLGGHDRVMISGRRVDILTKNGVLKGVTGKRAIHLMSPEDRKKVPEIFDMWIDIGAKDKEDALKKVRIGDVAVYNQAFEVLNGSIGIARAFDNKAGAYVVNEVARRLAKEKDTLAAKVVAVSSTQEEIGCRGARTSVYKVDPDFGIAVDVGHATDHPDCDLRKYGETKLGAGPIITRGPNINPIVFDRLIEVAEKENIPYQLEGDSRPTGTDGRELQMGRGGVATGVLSVPLRYMHTPSEVVDLKDIENTVRLIAGFARSLKKGDRGDW